MTKTNRFNPVLIAGTAISTLLLILALGAIKVSAAEMKQTDQSSTTATITWDKPDESDVACYYIGYGEDFKAAKNMLDTQKKKISVGYSSYTIEELKAGQKYVVYIAYKHKSSGVIESLVEDGIIHTGPAKVTGIKLSDLSNGLKNATFTWQTQEGASGYEYIVKDNAGKTVAKDVVNTGSESLVKINIDTKDFYKFQVRAYSNRFEKMVYGEWSTAVYFGAQPELTKANAKRSGLSLTWNKIKGAKSYTVYVSTSEKSGYKKITTTTKNTYTVKKLSSSQISKTQNYYVYIIANTKNGSKTYKSFKNMYNAVKGNQIATHVFD